MMKNYGVLVILFISLFLVPFSVDAQSISDYRAKIKSIEAEKAETESKSAEVQAKIDEAKAKIDEITRQIVVARKDQEKTQAEIKELDKQIDSKNEEIKDLVSFYQISDNDNFYLKFIFGADSFEDLIYRFSVTEQLTEANDNLVSEMNDLIKQNEEKIKELESEQKKLDGYNKEISAQIEKLGSQKRKYSENALDADEEIAALNKQIAFFKKQGCNETQDVTTCGRTASIPSANGFILPTSYGYVTSYYGGRIHPISGLASHHDGVDIAANSGTPVKASASGQVILADWYYGFGNAVMIVHKSHGNTYTTLYGHLSGYNTSAGNVVNRGDVIGYVGSTGNSTGPHLHFQAMYGSGYGTTFDPCSLVNIPLSW